jgi:hypothetical protein
MQTTRRLGEPPDRCATSLVDPSPAELKPYALVTYILRCEPLVVVRTFFVDVDAGIADGRLELLSRAHRARCGDSFDGPEHPVARLVEWLLKADRGVVESRDVPDAGVVTSHCFVEFEEVE